MLAMVNNTIVVTPPANPSKPSIKLIALVIPMTHTKVMMKEIKPISIEILRGRRMVSSSTPPTLIKTIVATA